MPQNKHSLGRSGSSEHHRFCECFDLVVSDESINPRQLDTLNILDPWRKVFAIDNDDMVIVIWMSKCIWSSSKYVSRFLVSPPCPIVTEDKTGNLRPVLEKDVITAWHTYMGFLYLIGGIRIPTKVYFTLSTLAGDSRCYFEKRVNGLRTLQSFS